MKYKVGDRVKIKDGLKKEDRYYNHIAEAMKKYAGKIMTIREINGNMYRMKEDNGKYYGGGWYWSKDMIEGLAIFTKSDLKDGDIVTYRNGEKLINVQGMLINKEEGISGFISNYNEDLTRENKYYKDTDIIKVERPTKYETIFERKEEILNEAEKRYLRGVIRPFRDKVRFIEKEDNGEISRIKICFDYHFMFFPILEKEKKMYEGMKANQAYNLKELGL